MDRRTVLLAAAGIVASRLAPSAMAQPAAPELKSLQIFVPTPAGTQPDLIARWLAAPIARRAELPVIVHNRPGAGGAIAADAALALPAENGPLLLGGLDHVAYSHLNSNRRPLDPFVDFIPIGTVNRDSWVMVTADSSGIASLAKLIEKGRANEPLSYASNGEGSTSHLVAARLSRALGITAQHVPYRDSILPDLLAGRIAFALMPTPAALPQIRSRKLRALGALSAERLPQLPDVPTVREQGYDGQVFHGGLFLFAAAALRPHATRLNGWLVEALRHPDVAGAYADAAIETMPLDLEGTRRAVAERLTLIDSMRLETFGRTRSG